MTPHEVTTGLVCGSVLIIVGLVPSLFWRRLAGDLAIGIQNFRDSISSGWPSSDWPRRSPVPTDTERKSPVWLAGLGALVITLTLLSYLSG